MLGSGIGYFSYGWGSPGDYPPANYPASAQTITPDALAAFTTPPEGDHIVESAPFTLTGWAIDLHAALSPGIGRIDVYAVPDLGAGTLPALPIGIVPTAPGSTYGDPVFDPGQVTLQYGEQFRHAGFSLPVDAHALTPDGYLLVGYAHSSASGSYDFQHPAVRALYIESEIQPLSVTLAGTGTGAVTSTPAGLSACTGGDGVQCSGSFDYGAVVTLTATGTNNSAFLGWTGACTGFAPCQVTLTQPRSVTANFGPPPPIVTTYYHLDPIGSVRALSNAAGQIIEQHDYLPYGEDTVAPGADPVRFGGKELDAETQQYYFGARHYRHTAGRFGTVDPILDAEGALFEPQQFNRYAYARNNPLRFVDPLRLYGCETSETHQMIDGLYTVVYNVSCGPDDGDRAFEERSWLNWVQNGLDAASLGMDATGVGAAFSWIPDLVNGGISAGRGDWSGAGLSMAAMVPYLGESANVTRLTKRAFRKNLGKITGTVLEGAHAHHVLPQKFLTRFEAAGINIHDPKLGAWWEAVDHLGKAAEYNARWDKFLDQPRTREEMLRFGRQMSAEYGLKIYF